MNDLNEKSVKISGYFRILAFFIVLIFTIFAGVKCHAIAPHVPDVGLQVKVDYHRKSVEKHRNQKASRKVDEYKEKKKEAKKNKTKKPKKPSKSDKKRATKHKNDTLA